MFDKEIDALKTGNIHNIEKHEFSMRNSKRKTMKLVMSAPTHPDHRTYPSNDVHAFETDVSVSSNIRAKESDCLFRASVVVPHFSLLQSHW